MPSVTRIYITDWGGITCVYYLVLREHENMKEYEDGALGDTCLSGRLTERDGRHDPCMLPEVPLLPGEIHVVEKSRKGFSYFYSRSCK